MQVLKRLRSILFGLVLALVVAVIGTIAFATSGVLAAAEAGLDWLGATVLAVVVSIGGGTIRDVLIGNLPVTWVRDEWPVITPKSQLWQPDSIF